MGALSCRSPVQLKERLWNGRVAQETTARTTTWMVLFAFVTNDAIARMLPRVVLLPLAAVVVAVVGGRAAWLQAAMTVEDQKKEAVRQFRAERAR